MNKDKPNAIIIGAGFTGCATAYDLALRGFSVTVVERGELCSGTSGRTHGLLHSGGRYCVNDKESAIECIDENMILRKIGKQFIEPNGGLFIAVTEDDLAYKDKFVEGAQACHIPVEEISPQKVLQMEPNLNPKTLAAYLVPDGTFDPLRLAMAFAGSAQCNGVKFQLYTLVTGLIMDGTRNVVGIQTQDRKNGEKREMRADIIVSATGAWAGQIATMAGANVPVLPTPGVMVAFDQRLCERTINRLNIPGDGDIALPQRRMMVVGTTSFETDDPDYVPVDPSQIQMMVERGAEMIPAIRECKMRGAFMASRPLIGSGSSARSIARTFKCFDHAESDGIGGFVTITGGKATTCRAMAEATANMVCAKLGINAPCQTRDVPLLSFRSFSYS